MKKALIKKVVASGLAFAMIVGGSTAAFADSKGRDKDKGWEKQNWKNNSSINVNVKGNIHISYDDMKGDDVEWAVRYIASLAAKRVFEGYEDGTFKPRNAISRIEAITAAVRLMGLREQAESAEKMSTKLNFKDAEQTPAWAVGYVAVALENDLFTESAESVQPNKSADRLWATTLLVKALKLEAEAKAKMNTKLEFKDAKQIPAGSVGYVAVAIEKGLIDGFEDKTFRPNQPVTRAQLAALLDRTSEHIEDEDMISGIVSASVYNNALTLTKAGVTSQLVLHPNAFVYRGGVQVNASALQVGDQVKVKSYNNLVIFVEVITPAAVDQTTFSVIGNLNATTLNTNGQITSVSITHNVNGTNQTSVYNVGSNLTITGNLSLLVPGQLIELKGHNQVVTSIGIK